MTVQFRRKNGTKYKPIGQRRKKADDILGFIVALSLILIAILFIWRY